MCEPNHSIVQWSDKEPDQDGDNGGDGDVTKPKPPNDNNGGGTAFATTTDTESRVKAIFGKTARWLKKIKGWLNLSKFGAGHHSTSGRVTSLFGKDITMVGHPNLYESRWWDLAPPELDGAFKIPGVNSVSFYVSQYSGLLSLASDSRYDNRFVAGGSDRPLAEREALIQLATEEYRVAQESAAAYDQIRTTANMSTFRRFLEESLMETHSPCGYLYQFLQCVANEAGRDKWLSIVKKVLTPAERLCLIDDNPRCPIVGYWGTKTSSLFQQKKTQLVKATLGVTRDRKLLQSHFACCDRLWT